MEALPKPNGKSIAAMLVSKAASPTGSKEPMDGIPGSEEEPEYTGKEACCEDMMSALSSNDVKGFMQALESFLDHR